MALTKFGCQLYRAACVRSRTVQGCGWDRRLVSLENEGNRAGHIRQRVIGIHSDRLAKGVDRGLKILRLPSGKISSGTPQVGLKCRRVASATNLDFLGNDA